MATDPDESGKAILGLAMQGGELQRLSPNSTPDQVVATVNDVIDRLNDLLKTQIFSDSTSKRYVQGFAPGRWPGGDFGVAIGPEGKDVLAVSFDELIFAWDFSTNKQYIRGGAQDYYDPDSGKNFMELGILPDDSGGAIIMKPGFNVEEAF